MSPTKPERVRDREKSSAFEQEIYRRLADLERRVDALEVKAGGPPIDTPADERL